MPPAQRRSLARLTLVLGALTATAPLSVDMYLPSLPALEREFAASTAAIQLTLSAFFVGLALGQLVYGPLSDRVGRKPLLYFGFAVYTAASAGCALAGSATTLVLWRLLQALGGCAGMVMARAVVRDLFDHRESARMLSLLMLVMGLAPILAPLLGGQVLLWLGWRPIFWLLALFGAACLLAVRLGLPETRRRTGRATSGAAWLAYRDLLTDRAFLGYALSGAFAQAGMFAYISGSPFVFIGVYGVPPQAYGWLFGINALGLIAASQVNRRVLHRRSVDAVLRHAHAFNAAMGLLLVAAALAAPATLIALLVPLFGYVASLGFTQPNAVAGALSGAPERAGSASALVGSVQFGLAALAGVIVGRLHDGTAVPMAAVIGVCGLLGVAANVVLVHGKR